MEEKDMVNDILENSSNFLKEYEACIVETKNMELRKLLQNLKNNYESFQYEIEKLAESKGYSVSEETATKDEINKVRNEFSE